MATRAAATGGLKPFRQMARREAGHRTAGIAVEGLSLAVKSE